MGWNTFQWVRIDEEREQYVVLLIMIVATGNFYRCGTKGARTLTCESLAIDKNDGEEKKKSGNPCKS